MEPTKGCLRAAEIIMNGKEIIETRYGKKKSLGIANVIYLETEIKELLEACKTAACWIQADKDQEQSPVFKILTKAIAKAEGKE